MHSLKKIIISCFSGTLLEFYEFAIFGYLTKQISQLFFPSESAIYSVLLTYAVFATGFIMRPVGALISGYLGDRRGRKAGLLFSISMMTAPTVMIGLLPTYEQIGVLAPILILICRMLQGISLGGEFGGSIIYLIENAPKNKPATYGSWADLGSGIGVICATLTVLALNTFLDDKQLLQWGWRIPFLFGLVFGLISYFVRRQLLETPLFSKAEPHSLSKNPLKDILKNYRLDFSFASTLVALTGAGYYIILIYLPQQLSGKYPGNVISLLQLACLFANNISNFIVARVSDRYNHYKTMSIGILGCIVLSMPAVYAFTHLSLVWIFSLSILFSVMLGICFGPRSAIVVSHFPVTLRYTGVALSYNIGNALFGGTAPLLATLLVGFTGSQFSTAYLVIVMGVISLISVIGLYRLNKITKIAMETEVPLKNAA